MPWGSSSIADEVAAFIRRFVVLTEPQLTACVLWVLHTWTFEAATTTPYLVVMSAMKRSGKTRLLEVLQVLAANPLLTGNISEAALFRAIELDRPTLLLDEVDATFTGSGDANEALRGLLNQGNRAGSSVIRCVGKDFEPKAFAAFCAKALAGIDNGRWPDTVIDRSIVLRLTRRTTDEEIERFRWAKVQQEATPLVDAMADWAEGHVEALREAMPSLPENLSDRACDGWEPLLAIADAMGGGWLERARDTALELFRREEQMEDSTSVLLLEDLRRVFTTADRDRMSSVDLVDRLVRLEERPWKTWGRRGFNPNALARLLRPFEIQSQSHRMKFGISESNVKGYLRADFVEAWARYLDDEA